jgi:hypothetical protein
MEKTIISWSVPNLITIWLMLFAGLFALTLVSQLVLKRAGGGQIDPGNNAGNY